MMLVEKHLKSYKQFIDVTKNLALKRNLIHIYLVHIDYETAAILDF